MWHGLWDAKQYATDLMTMCGGGCAAASATYPRHPTYTSASHLIRVQQACTLKTSCRCRVDDAKRDVTMCTTRYTGSEGHRRGLQSAHRPAPRNWCRCPCVRRQCVCMSRCALSVLQDSSAERPWPSTTNWWVTSSLALDPRPTLAAGSPLRFSPRSRCDCTATRCSAPFRRQYSLPASHSEEGL